MTKPSTTERMPAMRRFMLLLIALSCLVVARAAPAAEPLTSARIEAVLATYPAAVAAGKLHGFNVHAHLFGTAGAHGGIALLLKRDHAELRDDLAAIAREHGFDSFEQWSATFGRVIAAHNLPYFRKLHAYIVAQRQAFANNGSIAERKAGLLGQLDATEKALAASVAQAEADLPAVEPYMDQLDALFPPRG